MRTRNRLLLLALALGSALALPSPAAAEPVALTFDDLPTLQLTSDLVYAQTTTGRLLAALTRDRLPATGFVNESKLEGPDKAQRIDLLKEWLAAGADLGNHTYSHLSLNKTPLAAYIADTARGEAVTRALLATRGRTPRWFRHPYLETGLTAADRDAFTAWLAADRYRVAPVTMENADWMFAYPYDEAILKGERTAAVRIRGEYLAYTIAVAAWYREAALELLGRRPAFVFLLHASRLNGDSIDALSAILRSEGLTPVSLDQAMRDPAYAIKDVHVGPDGDEWISRWAETLHKNLPWSSFPQPPTDIAAAETRLDTSP